MSRNKPLRLERPKLSREEIRDAIAVGICDKLDPESDVLKICFSRKQLKQLSKSNMFISRLGKRCCESYWSKERNNDLFICRFCDLRTVHYKMFEKAFEKEGLENYKEFILKIYRSNWTKKENPLWFEEEEELNSSFIYLYNLYGEVRKWVNSTAFAMKLELGSMKKVKVKGQEGLYMYLKG